MGRINILNHLYPIFFFLLYFIILFIFFINFVSCGNNDNEINYIHDYWYDWPIEDKKQVINHVKLSNNHLVNSSKLFRSFDIQSNILQPNQQNFIYLKEKYLKDVNENKYNTDYELSHSYDIIKYTQFEFIPGLLDFKTVCLCISVVKQLEMKNLLLEDVTIQGITLSTPNFIILPIPKEGIIIHPGESYIIDVLFFPRYLDYVEDYLTFLTSVGRYIVKVMGVGIHNPYLLSPLINKHIAANTPFTPSIEIFNPAPETLQIIKLFTTGGFLNLPHQGDTPIEFWQVNPFETRSIIRLNFLSPLTNIYRGIVNIETHDHFVITLPVEITVHSNELIVIPNNINFGVQTYIKQKETRDLYILNSQLYPVLIKAINIVGKQDKGLVIDFKPILLPVGEITKIASISHVSYKKGSFNNQIRIYTNDSNPHFAEISASYYGDNIWGDLQINPKDTSFLVKKLNSKESRVLTFLHHFPIPIKLYNAESISESFRVISCNTDSLLLPNTPWNGITIQFSGNANIYDNHELTLSTNLTTLSVPLIPYNGLLSYSVLEQIDTTRVDFGILALNELSIRIVNISNPNPININIQSITVSLPRLQVRLEGIYNSIGTRKDLDIQNTKFTLESGYYALFILQVTCTNEELGVGQLSFTYNDKYNLDIAVSYHAMKGTLNLLPSTLQFSQSFPGRILQKTISVKSTYTKEVSIQSIQSSDPRIIPHIKNTTIYPNKRIEIATVYFNPSLCPEDENYMGSSLAAQILHPSADDTHALQIDRITIKNRDNIWNRLVSEGLDIIHGSLVINTDVISGHNIPFRAPLTRPSITKQSSYEITLTQIGSTTEIMIPIINPSDYPIQVQIYSINPPKEFLLPSDLEQPYIIQPRSTSPIGPIYFLPQYFHQTNVSVYLKNNLTILEMITFQGQGGSGLFVFISSNQTIQQKLGNNPLLLDSLQFNLTSNHTINCINSSNSSPFEITKTFIGINKGNLPVKIYGLSINYASCKDYGFRINPCGSFLLQPNNEINISITFIPDFTSSIVKRSLIVSTSQGDISFPLEAYLPYDLLPLCIDSQPLSQFQLLLRRIIFILSCAFLLVFCGLIINDFYFSSKIKHNSILKHSNNTNTNKKSKDIINIYNNNNNNTLYNIKKLKIPNEDHFIKPIDDFFNSLPSSDQDKSPLYSPKQIINKNHNKEKIIVNKDNKTDNNIIDNKDNHNKDNNSNKDNNKDNHIIDNNNKDNKIDNNILDNHIKDTCIQESQNNILSSNIIPKHQSNIKTSKILIKTKKEKQNSISKSDDCVYNSNIIDKKYINKEDKKDNPKTKSSIPTTKQICNSFIKEYKKEKEEKQDKYIIKPKDNNINQQNISKSSDNIKILSKTHSKSDSIVGISMLRSDGDSMVEDKEEINSTSVGVIGEITTPPRDSTVLNGLDNIFSRNPILFAHSDSLFSFTPNDNTNNINRNNNQNEQTPDYYQLF